MKKRVRKVTAGILVMAMSLLSLTACAGEKEGTAQEDYVLKIGTQSGSVCMAPLHVAEDLGYFKEEFEKVGLSYELVEIDVTQMSELVASGQVDASVGLSGGMIPQIDSGLEVAFTGGVHTGCTKYYVKDDSDIQSLEDLKGKKIGVPGLNDTSVLQLKRKLFDLGIGVTTDNMEVELVAYNMTDLPQALDNGAIDAAAMHDPVATSSQKEYGFRKILDLTEDEKFKEEYCCQTFVTTTAAEEHPEAAAAYTRAILKASAYVQAKPEEAAKLQIDNKQCSGDVKENAALLASYNYTPSVSKAKKTFRDASDELIIMGELTEGRDLDAFTEEHFKTFEDVPDSYVYEEDGTFTEA